MEIENFLSDSLTSVVTRCLGSQYMHIYISSKLRSSSHMEGLEQVVSYRAGDLEITCGEEEGE